jgi:hypothetical protein
MIGGVAFFALVGWIIRMTLTHKRLSRLAEHQASLHDKLLEKFSSSEDLMEYLRSDAALRFLRTAPVERTNPYGKILGSLQTGVVLAAAGAALLYLRTQIPDAAEGFVFLGAIGLAVGIAFLISGGLAYVLSKRWGLINGDVADSQS